MKLNTSPNLSSPDAAYELLISAHKGLGDDESAALNARLILTLVNHVGDLDILAEALDVARSTRHEA